MKKFKNVFFLLIVIILASNVCANADLNDGLVAYYPFNGDVVDESGNDHNATNYGATLTTDRFGHPNSAYSFDGASDYISTNTDFSWSYSDSFSISLWFKTSNPLSEQVLIGKSSYEYSLRIDDISTVKKSLYFAYWNSSSQDMIQNSYYQKLITDQWYHVLVTYEGNAKISKMYINGQLISTDDIIPQDFINRTNPTLIGYGYHLHGDNRYFEGSIDEVRIYNRELDISEFEESYFTHGTGNNVGDFDADGDIDSNDLAAFSKLYGTYGYTDELISLTEVPILDQSQINYAGGVGGCVPSSFAMILIHYFNLHNAYSLTISAEETNNIVSEIADYLEADVNNSGTWVKPSVIFDKMTEYSYHFDGNTSDDFVDIATWDIEYPELNEKSNEEWINFIIEKLSNNEPIFFGGIVFTPSGSSGHASVITGYKNIYGAEYFKINDTWSTTASWWRVTKNKSFTRDGVTENNLIRLDKDNGKFIFYINGRFANPTHMSNIQVPKL